MRSITFFRACAALALSAVALHYPAAHAAAQCSNCNSKVSSNFGDSPSMMSHAAGDCGCSTSDCGDAAGGGSEGRLLGRGRLASSLVPNRFGNSDSGCSTGNCGGNTPLRSRIFLDNPIQRGPASGVSALTRGSMCNGEGCEGCRGGLLSNLGSGRVGNAVAGRTANVASRVRNIGNGGFDGCNECNNGLLGTGLGSGLGSRIGSGGVAGRTANVASRVRNIGNGGFDGCNECNNGLLGTGLGSNLGSRIGSGGGGQGDPGLFGRLGNRLTSGWSDDCHDCRPGIGNGAIAGRLGDGALSGGRLAAGPGAGWGQGQGGGLMGGGPGFGACGPGCGGCHNCGSGLLHRGKTALHGLVGPSRGMIPHTSQPPYGAGMGEQSASYAYPYYTSRAPRDFLMDNPPSIGW